MQSKNYLLHAFLLDQHHLKIKMPPTPFHPTHTTPFKSSISSSQQAKKREFLQSSNSTNAHNQGGSWPVAVNAEQLDARHWTYLAEGGKNLLLRYTGPDVYPFVNIQDGRRMALRIGKSSRQQLNEKGESTSKIKNKTRTQ